jgi:murein DD-endopeptidase MepM/ murein hydrolase activator NlpD
MGRARFCETIVGALLLSLVIVCGLSWGAGTTKKKPSAAELARRQKTRELQQLIERKRRKITQVRATLEDARKRLREVNHREQDAARQLSETNDKLGATNEILDDLYVRRKQEEAALGVIRNNLRILGDRLADRQEKLARRLRDIYESRSGGYLIALLNAKSFGEFLNKLDFLKLIIQEDAHLMDEVRARAAEFQREKTRRDEKVVQINSLSMKYREEKRMLLSLQTQRESLLENVKSQRRELDRYVWELENITKEQERQLHRFIVEQQNLNAGKFTGRVGAYAWPVSGGYISSNFGWRIHPIRGRLIFHNGIDIAVSWGSPVRAANDGIVIFAGWYGGYGNTVVIDHGGGVSTLYAHCSQLYVTPNTRVTKGTTIAAVGSTGSSTGPHLHFEIRQNGTPINPRGRL